MSETLRLRAGDEGFVKAESGLIPAELPATVAVGVVTNDTRISSSLPADLFGVASESGVGACTHRRTIVLVDRTRAPSHAVTDRAFVVREHDRTRAVAGHDETCVNELDRTVTHKCLPGRTSDFGYAVCDFIRSEHFRADRSNRRRRPPRGRGRLADAGDHGRVRATDGRHVHRCESRTSVRDGDAGCAE